MIYTLQLIRHAKTKLTDSKVYCGSTDVQISDDGIDFIMEKKNLSSFKITDCYYTTDLVRTQQTLKHLFGDIKYKIIPELRECDFGIFEGKTHNELIDNSDYLAWIEDKTGDYKCPGGESVNSFNNRIKNAFIELFKNIKKSNLHSHTLVAHGGTISQFYIEFVNSSLNLYEAMPKYVCGYEVVFTLDSNATFNIVKINII